jgi:hypothetical protein
MYPPEMQCRGSSYHRWILAVEKRASLSARHWNCRAIHCHPPFKNLLRRPSGPNATMDQSGAVIDRLSNVFIPYYANKLCRRLTDCIISSDVNGQSVCLLTVNARKSRNTSSGTMKIAETDGADEMRSAATTHPSRRDLAAMSLSCFRLSQGKIGDKEALGNSRCR